MGVAGRNGYRTTATEKQALIERNNELWEKGEIGKKKAPKKNITLAENLARKENRRLEAEEAARVAAAKAALEKKRQNGESLAFAVEYKTRKPPQ
jgi:hypothetical protein